MRRWQVYVYSTSELIASIIDMLREDDDHHRIEWYNANSTWESCKKDTNKHSDTHIDTSARQLPHNSHLIVCQRASIHVQHNGTLRYINLVCCTTSICIIRDRARKPERRLRDRAYIRRRRMRSQTTACIFGGGGCGCICCELFAQVARKVMAMRGTCTRHVFVCRCECASFSLAVGGGGGGDFQAAAAPCINWINCRETDAH